MTFNKKNFYILAAAILLIIIGFILLSGGGAENPATEFSEEIYSFRRLWVAPIVLIGGFVCAAFAIFKRFEQ